MHFVNDSCSDQLIYLFLFLFFNLQSYLFYLLKSKKSYFSYFEGEFWLYIIK